MQSFSRPAPAPPALLVLELWGLGDLALAVPFLQEASRHARVTLVAKPEWGPLLARFSPEIEHVPFTAPWTAFRGKYRLHAWPWRELRALIRRLRVCSFDFGVSARFDPRDHVLLTLASARQRTGFPRAGSSALLHHRLPEGRRLHRAEAWRRIAAALSWPELPPSATRPTPSGAPIVLHSGAGQPTRIWPLERFAEVAVRLREAGRTVLVLCDPPQLAEWRRLGEPRVQAPTQIGVLLDILANAAVFIGNDAGPGHVAALCDIPTFTVFGPQLPQLFAPAHPQAAWIDGHPCPFKPCRDYCRFPAPHCIHNITVDEVWARLEGWVGQH